MFRFLKKLKIELPNDTPIPLLSRYPEKRKTLVAPNVHSSAAYNSQNVEITTIQVPINR